MRWRIIAPPFSGTLERISIESPHLSNEFGGFHICFTGLVTLTAAAFPIGPKAICQTRPLAMV